MRRLLDALTHHRPYGVLVGLEAPDPGSGLTLTYTTGLVRVKSATAPNGYTEYRVAGSTSVLTASKDTYVYIDPTTGAFSTIAVANGGTKPTFGTASGQFPVNAEVLWKVVTDGSDITSSEDLRRWAGIFVENFQFRVSFVTARQGYQDIQPGFAGRVLAIDGHVINALGDTDAGTVTLSRVPSSGAAGTTMTNGQLSFAASAAAGVRDLECPTVATHFGPSDRIRVTSAKTTTGGEAQVTVICERLI